MIPSDLTQHIFTGRKIFLIDLFCGAGGVSTGFENAVYEGEKAIELLACVNHDAKAIASHKINHPNVIHYTEDVRKLKLKDLMEKVRFIRASVKDAIIVLWASLECTNFSKAKGGRSRKADNRMLADEMYRYLRALDPDYFYIENVEEFKQWGPLRIAGTVMDKYCTLEVDKRGEYIFVPDKTKFKIFFNRWKQRIIKNYGYKFFDNDGQTLNAADYGACQSRKRYFAVFAKPHLPILFPEQTHAKQPEKHPGRNYKKWEPVRKALDLHNHGTSIFIPGRIKSEKSFSRIYEGLIKHVAGGKKNFLLKYNSVNGVTGKHVVPGIDEPCPTVGTQGRLGFVETEFIQQYNGGNRSKNRTLSTHAPIRTIDTQNRYALTKPEFIVNYNHSSTTEDIDKVGPSVVAADKLALAQCQFINKNYSGNPEHKNQSINAPAGAITTIDHHALVTTEHAKHYLVNYHGKHKDDKSIDVASGSITTKEDNGLVTAQFIKIDHGASNSKSIDAENNALVGVTKENLVTCIPFVMDTQFNNGTKSVDEPAGTQTANRKHFYLVNPIYDSQCTSIESPCGTITGSRRHWHYLVNPQWGNNSGNNINNPSPTLIARQDKSPLCLVTTEEGFWAIEVLPTDSPMVVKIKEFMALYGIVDIKMRILVVKELLRIQGFPEDYYLAGTQADQKKFIGNAVEVTQAKVIAEALAKALHGYWEERRLAA